MLLPVAGVIGVTFGGSLLPALFARLGRATTCTCFRTAG